MKQILDGSEPILLVSHDADDHGWQFIGASDAKTDDGRVVCLETMVAIDPTVLQIADLPPGWQAVRDSVKHPWKRRQRPREHGNEPKNSVATSFICTICHESHNNLPDIGSDRPDHYWDVPEHMRGQDIKLTKDTCEIAGEFFFIRGVLQIPVFENPAGFGFGVWVSHKKENFYKYLENFDTADIGPFFGWLCTRIKYYEADTLNLKTSVHYRGGGLRPLIQLESCDHPLAIDQQKGISLDKAWEIVHFYIKD